MDKINVYEKIMIKHQNKGKNMEINEFFYKNLHLIRGLGMEFTAC